MNYLCGIMNAITFSFSQTENAWVSEKVTLTGSIMVKVILKNHGKVVIKRQKGVGEPAPKVLVTKNIDEGRITISARDKGSLIQIFTSTEPSYLAYAQLNNI